MEFKKCIRCGSFYVSDNDLCGKCTHKDASEIAMLKNYFEENTNASSLEEISSNTGITVANLDRYMSSNEFKNIYKTFNNNDNNFNNISISL